MLIYESSCGLIADPENELSTPNTLNVTGLVRSPPSYDVATIPDFTVEPIPHGDVSVDIPVN